MTNEEHKLKGFNKRMLKYAKKPSMIAKFIKMYNNMCKPCTQLAMKDSKRPMGDYCDKCKTMMEDIYEK